MAMATKLIENAAVNISGILNNLNLAMEISIKDIVTMHTISLTT